MTSETPGHPARILRDGYAQAIAWRSPPEMVLKLKCAIYEAALADIAKAGGHAAIIAQEALDFTAGNKT